MSMPQNPAADIRSRGRFSRPAAFIFLLALAIRGLYLVELAGSPTFGLPVVDAWTYHRLGAELAVGRFGPALFWQSFLYPFFLALFHLISHQPLLVARVAQAEAGAATCALTALLGARLLGRRQGLAAGIATALYGPLIFHDGELLTAGWEAFWTVALVLLFLETDRRRGIRFPLLTGLAGGLAVLTRPTFLLPLSAGVLWLLRPGGGGGEERGRVRRAVPFLLAGLLMVLLPAACLCGRTTGRYTILSASGGINFYLGNNPDYCRSITVRPGWEWNRLTRLPSEAGYTGLWGRADWFSGEAFRYVRDHPLLFLKGMVSKSLRFISSRELPRNDDIYLNREWSAVLWATVWKAGRFGFPFGLLLPLAAAGLWFRRRELSGLLLLFILAHFLAVILVFPAGRYRIPVIPLLAVAAVAGAQALAGLARDRSHRATATAVLLVGGTFLLAVGPGPFCEERIDYRTELYDNLGVSAGEMGRTTEALAWFARAIARDPGQVDARNNLGAALARARRAREAVGIFDEALRLKPDLAEAWNNRGYALLLLGRDREAEESCRRALAVLPRYALAWNNLGRALEAQGRDREALEAYEAAAADPNYPAPRLNRERLLERLGAGPQKRL